MRRLPKREPANTVNKARQISTCAWFLALLSIATSFSVAGCVGLGKSLQNSPSPSPTPQPPSGEISISVAPTSAAVLLGNSQTFAATVKNSSDTGVSWSIDGIAGGNAAIGTITAAGVYSAPLDLPTTTAVQITATSRADASKTASANVTVSSDVRIALPVSSGTVELGATRNFRAAIASAGHPDAAVQWSLAGAACPAGCGAVDSSGNFTAPPILPNPVSATLTAQSVADPSQKASATVTITSNFTVQISAPASVAVNGTAAIGVMFTAVAGSNPALGVTWSLSGSGCSGFACGVLQVLTQQSAGSGATANTATYNAPAIAPNPNTITITVTPQADPTKKATATLTILAAGNVGISPATATLAANHRITLSVQVGGASGTPQAVIWGVNGIASGNAAVGKICVVATNPCVPVTNGAAAQVYYIAPGAIPSPNPVTVQATSAADSTKSASAQITILNHVVVTVQPASVTLAPLAVQGFAVSVIGAADQTVIWQVQGAACVVQGVCGAIAANGAYTAPVAAPLPDSVQVVAISEDDTSQSGAASVTISGGANILALHPGSVYSGGADGFLLRVDGSGFTSASPGPGSALLIAGIARTTTCSTAGECSAPVTAADVAVAGNASVQVQNPDGTRSNSVSLVVVAPNGSDEVVVLSSSTPVASAKDIVVVEPTTAGVSVPGNDVDLNLAALGSYSATNNSCSLTGNPVVLQRPASGGATADICLFSESGLDTSMTFSVSGPDDISVLSKQPVGLGIVRLTLEIPSTAAPGSRTLFVQNTNLDKAAASGSLVVN